MFRKITIAVICSLALIGSARAAKVWLLGNGGAGTPLGVSGGGSGGGAGNDLLLSDGSSFLLLSDGSSKLCLASGC